MSLDGRLAPPDGGAAQLGGPGDRRVLEEALAWADGALVGAETLRRHGSTCLIHHPDLLAQRRRQGRGAQPHALVLSRTGVLPAGVPFWQQPLQRWWLRPRQAGSSPTAAPFDRQLPFDSLLELRQQLAGLGLSRLVLLGGADLASQWLAAGLVDELQLTLCPLLLGGAHSWCAADPGLGLDRWRWRLLEQRPLEGDELLLRYGREEPPAR
ncbi:MAG: dihydrofolate reductase family protein [Cyanobium sp. M30B3]|nr:MAG: dihydrofolate reductase family protein [Cyanobium sp. M30B3]